MALRLKHWSDTEASKEITRRYKAAQSARKRLEDQWNRNEQAVYGFSAGNSTVVMDALGSTDDIDGQDTPDISVAYTFKNFRFIHSQLSSNPPSVAMRPTSSDQADGRKADAADRSVRHMIRQYTMQEKTDIYTMYALLYGTAAMKTVWDSTKGDILEFDEKKQEILMEGDMSIIPVHTRNLFLDPDAHTIPDLKWVIERVYVDYDEAVSRWPGKEEKLKAVKIERGDLTARQSGMSNEDHYNSIELLEYWETGLPTNGYMGRFCILLGDGTILESCKPSPFRFTKAGTVSKLMQDTELPEEVIEERKKRLPQMASLPYHILTDIDVPNTIWGKSFLEYAAPLQEVLAQIDSAYIDNIRANGVARMVISEDAEVNLDMSNSPWDVTRVSKNQAPYFMEVPNLMPEMGSSRQNMIEGINEVSGVNESMFGQQSREQSGASMQYATNQGNMIRRRLFNKYVLAVESIYKAMLNLARKHWTIERTVLVLGEEKAFEALALKGTDLDGGYDVVGEYGVTLSLDPVTRRQEIMQMQPMFEKAGIPPRMSLRMMKLNDLNGLFDKPQMAEDRQREIFEEQIATGRLIEPEEFQDHENMMAWALDYFMTAEFKYLSDEEKELCKEHFRKRKTLAAQEMSGGLSGQPQPPGPAGEPGAPPGIGAAAVAPIPGAPTPTPIVNG